MGVAWLPLGVAWLPLGVARFPLDVATTFDFFSYFWQFFDLESDMSPNRTVKKEKYNQDLFLTAFLCVYEKYTTIT